MAYPLKSSNASDIIISTNVFRAFRVSTFVLLYTWRIRPPYIVRFNRFFTSQRWTFRNSVSPTKAFCLVSWYPLRLTFDEEFDFWELDYMLTVFSKSLSSESFFWNFKKMTFFVLKNKVVSRFWCNTHDFYDFYYTKRKFTKI